MTELHFFERPQQLTAQDIAALTGAVLRVDVGERRIRSVAPLDRAGPHDLAFMQKAKFADDFAATRAGICLTTEKFAARAPAHVTVLVTPAPYRAFVAVAQKLFPGALRPSSLFDASGMAPGAFVHPTARVEANVTVDPNVVIGPQAEIGAGTRIAAGAVIGPSVRIGRDCNIGAGATIQHALVGDRVIIHPGVRIGQDGFGYLAGFRGHGKVPQLGRVLIQDDVEIGANSTIDRGGLRDTVIGEGTKIDNLVQIGHNVEIGRHCILVSQVGVSGSCVIGDFVMLGGKVGVADNLTIGQGAMVAAGSGLISNVPAGEHWGGYPARPSREWFRSIVATRKLGRRSAAREGGE
jgi:UDP-3-O-[3-hydroxymyristoyl] glucosamine N-acyltransferase